MNHGPHTNNCSIQQPNTINGIGSTYLASLDTQHVDTSLSQDQTINPRTKHSNTCPLHHNSENSDSIIGTNANSTQSG